MKNKKIFLTLFLAALLTMLPAAGAGAPGETSEAPEASAEELLNQAAAYFYGKSLQIDYAKSFELLNQAETQKKAMVDEAFRKELLADAARRSKRLRAKSPRKVSASR